MAEPESRVPFQQAGIGVEKRQQFEQLHSALERVFGAGAVGGFLKLLLGSVISENSATYLACSCCYALGALMSSNLELAKGLEPPTL